MSISSTTTTVSVTTVERTWRATLETPYNAKPPGSQLYLLSLHREKLSFDGDGAQVGDPVPLPAIVVPFSAVAEQSFSAGEITVTGAQIAAVLEAAFDQLASAAEAARVAEVKFNDLG